MKEVDPVKRILIAILAVLLLAQPAVAESWRTPPPSRLPQLDAELAPVLVRTLELQSLIPETVRKLTLATGTLDGAKIKTAADVVDAAFAELAVVADDGLTVLDGYVPEACYLDYYTVMHSGFLLLGEAGNSPSTGGFYFNLGMYLVLTYGDALHEVTVC